MTPKFSAKEFAKRAIWLPDGQISYDFSFTEYDVGSVETLSRQSSRPLESALRDFLASPEERADYDPHRFVRDFFYREVEAGYALDDYIPNSAAEPDYTLRKFIKRECFMNAIIKFPLVEHWVFCITQNYYNNAVRRGQKLTEKKRIALASLLGTYMSGLAGEEFMHGYADVIDYNCEHDAELIMRNLRVPYVPAAWYKKRVELAEKRRAEKHAKQESERILQAARNKLKENAHEA